MIILIQILVKQKEIFLKKVIKRMYTIFVYLKNAIKGGETNFPILNK